MGKGNGAFAPCLAEISFLLNGKEVTVQNPDPTMLLSEYIRDVEGLKGTKVFCEQGGCGSCTVLIAPADPSGDGTAVNRPINSCLKPLMSVDGMIVITVEGVGSQKRGMHAVQEELVKHNGSQCGFCTPGFVMSMYSLLQEKPEPTPQEVEDQFDGNICRCTGYRPILDGFQKLARGKAVTKGCKSKGSQDIEDLCIHDSCSLAKTKALVVESQGVTWMKVHALDDVYALLNKYTEPGVLRLVAGNTSTGVYAPPDASILVDISQIAELKQVAVSSNGLTCGSATPISDLMMHLEKNGELSPSFLPLVTHMKRVAGPQVRNVGTVGGNLMMTLAHPEFVSDLATILMAAGALLTVVSASNSSEERQLSLQDFFRLNAEGLVMKSVFIPCLPPGSRFYTFKMALRRVNAHALVNAGFCFDVDSATGLIQNPPTIVYGGIKKLPQRAMQTEAFLGGKSFMDEQVVQSALAMLEQELVADPTLGRTAYRASLVPSFLYKALLRLWPSQKLPAQLQTAAAEYVRPISSGDVSFDDDPALFPVTKPLHKLSEAIQATGEAKYVDDLEFANALHAALVLTSEGNADIQSIDASLALEADGVRAFLSAEAIANAGFCNAISEHENLFATNRSLYCGQAVGLILADSKRAAEAAAKLVAIKYSNVQVPILTVADAVAADSFFPESKCELKTGSSDMVANADVVVEGEVAIGHQYHFHLETQRSICVPGEDECMTVYSSTQSPSQVQQVVATALNVAQHKVKVEVKRVGGAYGSKINRATPTAMACAIAAAFMQRPVRLLHSLPSNMQNVGGRSPYHCKYKVGVSKDGQISAIQMRCYNNQGAHYDLDYPDMSAFFCFMDNVYSVPNWDVEIICVKTNLPACTYMRGPSFVEAVFILETMVEHVAAHLGLPSQQVRQMNMYRGGEVTPAGQTLRYCNARTIFEQLQESADYLEREQEVAAFNSSSRWVKRGISLLPVRFCMAWEGSQFQALVNIYTDGSVNVLQAGVELGQGLNVKVAQVAAYTLSQVASGGCPMDMVRVGPCSTDVANNVMSTGGSITSELCAMAVQEACKLLVERLKPVAIMAGSLNGGSPLSWSQLIEAAVSAGVDLQARGRVFPGASPDGPFQYMSYGAAVTEAEVDLLTGDTRLLKADLLLDCGKSLNPAVDIGQVQGAYVMGLGYFLSEEGMYDAKSGQLLSDDTWEYKPPSSKDIPHVFNAALLQKSDNPSGFLRSKASGEPPYAMAASALLAVRAAVAAGRSEAGDSSWLPLSSPATVEKVAMAASVPRDSLKLK